jgi:hypothetical protein
MAWLRLDPGEGSETTVIGLATFHCDEPRRYRRPPFWIGRGCAKTQYDFIGALENGCRILDILREEGILYRVHDTCEYYQSRNWRQTGPIANDELAFALVGSAFAGMLVGNLREEGATVKVLADLPFPRPAGRLFSCCGGGRSGRCEKAIFGAVTGLKLAFP